MGTKDKKKIYVGLSGGVDSSVSLSILKDEGHDVYGVFIRVWYPSFVECDWKKERRDAMRVCAHLDVPFLELNLEKEYKEDVVDYMIREYKKGRTPNPDIMCNRSVKFGAFKAWALKEGADYVATGHYARVKVVESNHEIYQLHAGVDSNKDQSYFLWTLTQEDLKYIMFPVGHLEKSEVRAIASEKGLPTATKKDSQGVCFLGEIDMKEFLSHYIDPKEGPVINEEGEVIGSHDGAHLFTIGGRRGFQIIKKTPNDKPRYVVSKDLKNNTITAADKKPVTSKTESDYLILESVNWVGKAPEEGVMYKARVRYRQALQDCFVHDDGGYWKVEFKEPQEFVASGQSLVVYCGDVCMGGGVIS